MSKLPSLASTVEWMVPLIRHLQVADVPNPPWQKQIPFRRVTQPVAMTLADEPIKAVSKVMPLYARREQQLADALTSALGPEWLVQPVDDHKSQGHWRRQLNFIGGQVEDGDVEIVPDMTAFIYDRENGHWVPGKSFKSGAQFKMWLHARRFESESHKVAYLICK